MNIKDLLKWIESTNRSEPAHMFWKKFPENHVYIWDQVCMDRQEKADETKITKAFKQLEIELATITRGTA